MKIIKIQTTVNAPLDKVWNYWTKPEHVIKWNYASDDWHCPEARNNFIVGGEFHYTMAAKDNSASFDFWGTFTQIFPGSSIEIILGDGRKLRVSFEGSENSTIVTEEFEPEQENPIELQEQGWQMILNNFKKYTEEL